MSEDSDPRVLHFEVIVYGSFSGDGSDTRALGPPRRVELQLRVRIPSREYDEGLDAMNSWALMYAHDMCIDVKHSEKWHCAFCGTSFVPSFVSAFLTFTM